MGVFIRPPNQPQEQTDMQDENITCPNCGNDTFSVALLHHRPNAILTRDEEGGVEIADGEGEFEGDGELHGEFPYLCEGCGARLSEDQLLAA